MKNHYNELEKSVEIEIEMENSSSFERGRNCNTYLRIFIISAKIDNKIKSVISTGT